MSNQYDVISLDVWGNEEDGYQVNNTMHSGYMVTINDSDSDDVIIKTLKELGVMSEACNTDTIEIRDGGDNSMIFIDEAETGEPLWQLHKVD